MAGQNQEQDLNQLLKVRREKLAQLQAEGRDPFQITKYDVTAHTADIKENYEELEGKNVSIAGRMMSKRVMGKASFWRNLCPRRKGDSFIQKPSDSS